MPVVLAVMSAGFLAIPLFVVIPMSFSTALSFEFPPPGYGLGYYRAYFNSGPWLMATANSFIIAFLVMIVTLILVIPAGFGFVRHKFGGRAMGIILLMLPMIVPQVVTALAYYGFLAQFSLSGKRMGMVIAHTSLAIPIAFLVVIAMLKDFDRNLERAAMNLGAGPLRTFYYVTFPVLRPGLLVAALFAFLQSFNEAVVAIFIGGRDASTVPKRMFESIRNEADPVIAVISTLLILIVLSGAAVAIVWRRRVQRVT